MYRSHLAALLVVVFSANSALPQPVAYDLDPKDSRVTFTYSVDGSDFVGSFPDFSTELYLDLDNISASTVQVSIKTTTASGGFVLATDAIRGNSILDSARFPTILFSSTGIQAFEKNVNVQGDITIKGVTLPIVLAARISRPSGSGEAGFDDLTVKLSAKIDRDRFGVSGYRSLVGNVIKINVTARVLARQ